MTKDNLESVAKTLELAAEFLREQKPATTHNTCFDCEYWSFEKWNCKKVDQTPPLNIIYHTCPEFVLAVIPF